MSERDAGGGVDPVALAVRTAMRERLGHCSDGRVEFRLRCTA
jgi:hypothetical protein